MAKLSETLYNKNTPTARLLDEIGEKAAEKGLMLSRWQTNGTKFQTRITYAIHTGIRCWRSDQQEGVIASVTLNQTEGTSERCEAFKKLSKLASQF